ncbi:MAG: MATE family efflux transporter [Pelomonas sp.]|nr:MATE family efflux transporter [Burkholderiaceae bacterium]MBV8605084.1 MATE family efflux transporter [Roseateles sp.]
MNQDNGNPSLLRLTWPIFAEQSLHVLTGVVDTLMVSQISDQAVAGIGSAWQIIFLFMMCFNVLAVGASIVCTHHLGQADRAGALRMAVGAISTNLWLGFGFSLVLAWAAPTLLRWVQLPPALMAYGLPFLRWMGGTLFLESMNYALAAVLRAHGHTRSVMWVMLAQNIVNGALTACFVFGWLGAPQLGATGVALATVFSRLLACLALWILARHDIGLHWRPANLLRIPAADLKRLLSYGLPAVGENLGWFSAFMFVTAMTARMGATALSTQTYVLQVASLSMLFSISVGLGNEILVGRLVGAGQFERAHQMCLQHMKLGLVWTTAIAALMALLGPWLLAHFTQDEAILSQGTDLIRLGLLLEPGRSFNLIMINALRAAGDTRFPVKAGILSQWGVMAFGAWLLGTWAGWGLPGVWSAFIADEWLRGLVMLRRWRRQHWLEHARTAQIQARGATL